MQRSFVAQNQYGKNRKCPKKMLKMKQKEEFEKINKMEFGGKINWISWGPKSELAVLDPADV